MGGRAVIFTYQKHLRGVLANGSQLLAIDKFPMGYFVVCDFPTISRDELWEHLARDIDRDLSDTAPTLSYS